MTLEQRVEVMEVILKSFLDTLANDPWVKGKVGDAARLAIWEWDRKGKTNDTSNPSQSPW
jgi:hypothetical protein